MHRATHCLDEISKRSRQLIRPASEAPPYAPIKLLLQAEVHIEVVGAIHPLSELGLLSIKVCLES